MIGWRGRIGLIIPSTNTTVEHEYIKMAPRGISVHISRVYNAEVSDPKLKEASLLNMENEISRAAKELASIQPQIIAFCCTSGSFVKGKGHDQEIIASIEKTVGISAITTSTAVLEAFKELSIKKIAMATPYNEDIAAKEITFFEESLPNLRVVAIHNLGVLEALAKGKLHPSSAYIAARKLDVSQADAVFISCTAWRTIEIIELLEEDLNKPVITSNQATMWLILKKMGIRGKGGYGKLMDWGVEG